MINFILIKLTILARSTYWIAPFHKFDTFNQVTLFKSKFVHQNFKKIKEI